jgi:hypothetical protein
MRSRSRKSWRAGLSVAALALVAGACITPPSTAVAAPIGTSVLAIKGSDDFGSLSADGRFLSARWQLSAPTAGEYVYDRTTGVATLMSSDVLAMPLTTADGSAVVWTATGATHTDPIRTMHYDVAGGTTTDLVDSFEVQSTNRDATVLTGDVGRTVGDSYGGPAKGTLVWSGGVVTRLTTVPDDATTEGDPVAGEYTRRTSTETSRVSPNGRYVALLRTDTDIVAKDVSFPTFPLPDPITGGTTNTVSIVDLSTNTVTVVDTAFVYWGYQSRGSVLAVTNSGDVVWTVANFPDDSDPTAVSNVFRWHAATATRSTLVTSAEGLGSSTDGRFITYRNYGVCCGLFPTERTTSLRMIDTTTGKVTGFPSGTYWLSNPSDDGHYVAAVRTDVDPDALYLWTLTG